MVVGAAASGPAEQALVFGDVHVVDAGVALGHVTLGVKQPVLVAVAPPPLPARVVRFVDEADRNAVGR